MGVGGTLSRSMTMTLPAESCLTKTWFTFGNPELIMCAALVLFSRLSTFYDRRVYKTYGVAHAFGSRHLWLTAVTSLFAVAVFETTEFFESIIESIFC